MRQAHTPHFFTIAARQLVQDHLALRAKHVLRLNRKRQERGEASECEGCESVRHVVNPLSGARLIAGRYAAIRRPDPHGTTSECARLSGPLMAYVFSEIVNFR